MHVDDPALVNRFVLFFDFLGTSEAAKSWPRDRVHAFVDLLISISQVQSAEDIDGEPQDDGSYHIRVTPEVTTFSDHVVVSYSGLTDVEPPLNIPPKKGIDIAASHWTTFVCADAIRILCGVAEMGLRIGLLIRGGLSFGQLYHQNGVVFGEAMIDAYDLESNAAKTPRIVISDRVLAKITHCQPEDMDILLRDDDGKWHLNYFAAMVREAMPPPSNTVDQAMLWKRAHLQLVRDNISGLKSVGNHRAAKKWEWFKNHFETAASSISD